MLRCNVPSSPCIVARIVALAPALTKACTSKRLHSSARHGRCNQTAWSRLASVWVPQDPIVRGRNAAPVMSEKYASTQACNAGSSGTAREYETNSAS